jgi:hypothetical protein
MPSRAGYTFTAVRWMVPGRGLEFLVATLVLLAGAHALREPRGGVKAGASIGARRLALVGVVTGVGSAMSGTGGPLILVPVLVWMGLPILAAVGLSQVVQLPLATVATLGNLRYGEVDFVLGLGIAVLLMAGSRPASASRTDSPRPGCRGWGRGGWWWSARSCSRGPRLEGSMLRGGDGRGTVGAAGGTHATPAIQCRKARRRRGSGRLIGRRIA